MKIRVIRAYSGEEGVGPDKDVHEGTEHDVTRARGSQLKANGLVEVLSDEDAESGEEGLPVGGIEGVDGKAAPTPENKQAPAPANKRTPRRQAEGAE